MSEHPNAIDLDKNGQQAALLGEQSHEIMRVWVTNGEGSSVWIDARALEDPVVFGYLMSDTIRHAAKAYATTWGRDESAMLEAIVGGLSEELRHQVGSITTIQEGSLD